MRAIWGRCMRAIWVWGQPGCHVKGGETLLISSVEVCSALQSFLEFIPIDKLYWRGGTYVDDYLSWLLEWWWPWWELEPAHRGCWLLPESMIAQFGSWSYRKGYNEKIDEKGDHVQGSVALPWNGVDICSLGQDQPGITIIMFCEIYRRTPIIYRS